MSKYGDLIKGKRIFLNIKQTVLARGICSVSYLSKIENNLTEPSEQILDLLLERLNIVIERVSINEEENIMLALHDMYKKALLNRNPVEVEDFILRFDNQFVFNSRSNNNLHKLYIFRFLLIVNKDIEQIKKGMNFISLNKEFFGQKELFIYYINICLVKYLEGFFSEALQLAEEAMRLQKSIALEDWEKADFENILCLCYFVNKNYSESVRHGSEALKYYNNNLILQRVIDCHITLGNSQKKLMNYTESENHLKLASELSVLLNKDEYKGMIAHNLGLLFSVQGDSQKAISYYKKSLVCKVSSSLHSYLLTVYALVKEYAKKGDSHQILKMCKIGLLCIDDSGCIEKYRTFYYHFQVYNTLYSKSEDTEEILTSALEYFVKTNNFLYIKKYSIALGEYYFDNKQYKKSNKFYRSSVMLLLKENSITSWEEL